MRHAAKPSSERLHRPEIGCECWGGTGDITPDLCRVRILEVRSLNTYRAVQSSLAIARAIGPRVS